MNQHTPIFADKQAIFQILGIRNGTLKTWRIGRPDAGIAPVLREGIHWIRQSSRHTLYNVPLLRDFIANRANPEAHERAIAAYLASLPSSQSTPQAQRRSR
jgi:hypothetical protein